MVNGSQETLEMSIKSLESTLNKLIKSYKTMKEKGATTTLVEKRLQAIKIGLEGLKGKCFSYDEETLLNTKKILQSLIPPIEKQIGKAKKNSPQRTLNKRRLTAIKLAIESLENQQ